MSKKFAIIDLGSNSVRMIIMKVYEDGSFKMIDQEKEMVRLSEKMGEEKTLKPKAIQRTLFTLKLFKKLIDSYDVDCVYTAATAAVRNAANQQFFIDKVKTETGFDFEVISGEQEAYYDYLGVINTVQVDDCVIIDTGGASTEIILVKDRRLMEAVSLPFGAVILTEKFLGKNGVPPESIKNTEAFVNKCLKDIPWLEEAKGFSVVGLGGSIRTLAKIEKKKTEFPLQSLHNYRMPAEHVLNIYQKITTAGMEERKNIPGVNKERADIIAGGLVPLKILMEKLNAPSLMISGNGLREGIFFKHYLRERGIKKDIMDNVLEHSIDNILKNYDANLRHSSHVQKLALALYDQMRELHGMDENARKLLSVSAMLHDVGMYVDFYNHHKHGFYLVLNSRLNGLTAYELVACAYIVGMHAGDDFKLDWKEYGALIDKDHFEQIKKLSMFVRIAEELDRNEYGTVENIHCYIMPESVQIALKSGSTPELEIAAAMKNEKAFEKLFNRKLYIV